MGFWDHVAELRLRIIWSLLGIAAGTVLGLLVYDWLLDRIFLPPYCRVLESQQIDRPCTLVITSPLEGFRTRIRVSLYFGVVTAMPLLLWQLWRFVTPALQRREKRWIIPFVAVATALFAGGAGVAYFTFERALEFLIAVSGDSVDPLLGPGAYLGLVMFMMIAFGIGFEFPVVLVFAQLAGIVTPRRLHRVRRYAIVGIVAAAAVITPSGDPVSLAALSVPMYIFYELSILTGHLLTRRRRPQPPGARRLGRIRRRPDAAAPAANPSGHD